MRQDIRDRTGVARRGDTADGDGGGNRTVGGLHDVLTHRGQKPVGCHREIVGRAVLEHHAELVRGEATEHVAGAHAAAQPPPDRRDHLVGDAEAVQLVDARQIVDRDHHEAAGAAVLQRFFQSRGERFGQRVAVHLAGEAIEARQISELLLVLMPLGDGTNDTMGTSGTTVRPRKPAAVVLDPERRRAVRPGQQAVFGLIRDAGAVIAPAASITAS